MSPDLTLALGGDVMLGRGPRYQVWMSKVLRRRRPDRGARPGPPE